MTREPMKARAIKVPDKLWADALTKAAERDEILSEVIREFLQRYVKR